MIQITPYGAAQTVSGSKYLVSTSDSQILVDCGLFQGSRAWRRKNWELPIDPKSIDAVVLTHAHIDHSGLLPRYVKMGLDCPIYLTTPSVRLVQFLLLDSARLNEEETRFRTEHKASRHASPEPLFTELDAHMTLSKLAPVEFGEVVDITSDISARWKRAGHILGAASIELLIDGQLITFSGDIGRYNSPILRDPESCELEDLLFIEATYGASMHKTEPEVALAETINKTAKRGGVILIPAFAVGRTQTLLYYLKQLKEKQQIPNLDIYVDSPMAIDTTNIYKNHSAEFNPQDRALLDQLNPEVKFCRAKEDSKKINNIDKPIIIISASGMLTGGRILHHLRHRIVNDKNTLLLVGYQDSESRGAWLQRQPENVRIFGTDVPVRAEVTTISGLSAHADQADLLKWLNNCNGLPSRIKIVHSEETVAQAFAAVLKDNIDSDISVAQYGETEIV